MISILRQPVEGLEVGKLADIVVLSHDLLTIDLERTTDAEVELTVLGGRVVFER